MNNSHGITAENLLLSLPLVLQRDSNMHALASSISEVLTKRKKEIEKISIYPNIDALPEGLLDILAQDFKVDWYDPEYTIDEKRKVIKSNSRIHRQLGTKGAVENALSDIYPGTTVEEWFEYDGEPYHFKIIIDISHQDVDAEKHQKVLNNLNHYKNLRSVLDGVEYRDLICTATSYTAAVVAGCSFRGAAAVAKH